MTAGIRALAARMPTYVTLKDVKARWGHGQEDVFPVTQFEKLWGDMTALPELRHALRRRLPPARAAAQRAGATGRLAARRQRRPHQIPLPVVNHMDKLVFCKIVGGSFWESVVT